MSDFSVRRCLSKKLKYTTVQHPFHDVNSECALLVRNDPLYTLSHFQQKIPSAFSLTRAYFNQINPMYVCILIITVQRYELSTGRFFFFFNFPRRIKAACVATPSTEVWARCCCLPLVCFAKHMLWLAVMIFVDLQVRKTTQI